MNTLTVRSLMRHVLPISALLAGVAQGGNEQAQVHYRLTNLASLGGTSSNGKSINNRAWITGRSNLAGNHTRHATLWRGASLTDLGTLGGPNSAVVWPVKNVTGIVSGIAQTSAPDPLGEQWSCSFFFPGATATGYQCLGFRWRDGLMTALPTLGGTNGFAAGTNNRGQTVGWAENTVHDPSCVPPQVLQFRAVLWDANNGATELAPLQGDSVSAATAINDRGQAVGISGICDIAVGEFSAIHAVRWENGCAISATSAATPGTRRLRSTSAATSSASRTSRPDQRSTSTPSCGRLWPAFAISVRCLATPRATRMASTTRAWSWAIRAQATERAADSSGRTAP